MTFVATAKPAAARAFYEGVLGLTFIEDSPFALVFDLRGTMLRIQKVSHVVATTYTALGWQVADIRKAVQSLTEAGVGLQALRRHAPGRARHLGDAGRLRRRVVQGPGRQHALAVAAGVQGRHVTGRRSVNVAPLPGAELHATSPPCASTKPRTIDRPRPAPSPLPLRPRDLSPR